MTSSDAIKFLKLLVEVVDAKHFSDGQVDWEEMVRGVVAIVDDTKPPIFVPVPTYVPPAPLNPAPYIPPVWPGTTPFTPPYQNPTIICQSDTHSMGQTAKGEPVNDATGYAGLDNIPF